VSESAEAGGVPSSMRQPGLDRRKVVRRRTEEPDLREGEGSRDQRSASCGPGNRTIPRVLVS
jgi:hypothetical protein